MPRVFRLGREGVGPRKVEKRHPKLGTGGDRVFNPVLTDAHSGTVNHRRPPYAVRAFSRKIGDSYGGMMWSGRR